MGTRLRLSEAENLAETLDVGNFTTDGQQIEALNGGGFLNLRAFGFNDFYLLANDITGAKSFVAGTPTITQIGWGSVGHLAQFNDTEGLILHQGSIEEAVSVFGRSGVGQQDKTGLLNQTHSILSVVSATGFTSPYHESIEFLFLNTGRDLGRESSFLAGVTNTVIVAGKGITAKTDDTLYTNQISLQESTILFDTILKASTATADRTATIQDASGTIAYLSDIGTSSFAVNLDSAESTVTRAVAGGRTTFTVTHNLGSLDIKPEVFRLSDGRTIGWRIERTGINTVEASRAGNVANGLFRILI